MVDYTGDKLRRALVRAGRALWNFNIHDPGDEDMINMLFEVNDWGDWLARKTGGKGYDNQPGVEYCGHTVAWAARHVGDHLGFDQCVPVTVKPKLAQKVFASTYRLSAADKWREAGCEKPEYVAPERIKAGDIVTVGDGKRYGTHIVLVEYDLEGDTFKTIEGNSTGLRADGTHGKGVVRKKRNLSEVACVYRLNPSHFIEQSYG